MVTIYVTIFGKWWFGWRPLMNGGGCTGREIKALGEIQEQDRGEIKTYQA